MSNGKEKIHEQWYTGANGMPIPPPVQSKDSLMLVEEAQERANMQYLLGVWHGVLLAVIIGCVVSLFIF